MKIERAAIEGVRDAATPAQVAFEPRLEPLEYELGPLPAGLSVATADNPADAVRVCRLVAETLYGVRSTEPWPLVMGEVDISSRHGRFRLRRRCDATHGARFTIAGLDGQAASGETLARLLDGVESEVVTRVFYSTPATHGDLSLMVTGGVAQQLRAAGLAPRVQAGQDSATIDEALRRRDEVTREIETRLASRRRASGELESQLTRVDAEATELKKRREAIEKTLRGVETELASVESNLRYQAIATETERAAALREAADWRPRIDELEQQIEQWRATLAKLEAREAAVRSELSSIHPDDAEPTLPLADQRAGLAVARRLVEDLESEVARLARSAASDACVCRDAHPRMNPLVDTLGKQLARLANLAEQQERALEVQSLSAEAAHLARSQDDLRKQLDHLISRRQALWRTTRARPEEDLWAESTEATAGERLALDQRRRELLNDLSAIDQRLKELAAERQSLVARRSSLLTDAPLEALQAELNELQARLHSPQSSVATPSPAATGRASQWFAKLVDGRFIGLGLVGGDRRLVAVEPGGAEVSVTSLSPSERQLAVLSLRLAVAGGLAGSGVHLPLVLEEPFAGLDNRQAAILANVLDDFARLGHQALVFTEHKIALDRFAALGVPLLRIGAKRNVEKTITPRPEPEPVATSRVVKQRVRSEYLLAPEDSIERFPAPIANRQAVFARSRVRTIADLISADPSALAEELDRDDVTAELASLWQTHTALVCFVPGMTFDLASLLTTIEVLDAEDLADADATRLCNRLESLLAMDRGGRKYSLEEVSAWIASAQRGVKRWRDTEVWQSWRRRRGERRERIQRNARRPRRADELNGQRLRVHAAEADRSKRPVVRQEKPKQREWKFYLDTSSPVVEAPSIGPKMSERLAAAGVETVADLLAADPEALAGEIGLGRVTDETIVAWQHQAQLVCRIPLLRGHDAQVLVECGFTQPEEIAAMKPAELLEFVEPFCSTEEGQRVLRSNKTPDLAEVTDWIEWSRHCRLLEAA